MDCIVLAGNRNNYRGLADESNKAFLCVHGRPILMRVLEQVGAATSVDRVLVVGPRTALEAMTAELGGKIFGKPLICVEQGRDPIDNVYLAVDAAGGNRDLPYLIVPSDVPLIRAVEIDSFLAAADPSQYDFASGLTHADSLKKFYPVDGKPGIVQAYFQMAEGAFRINNMHMVRPSAVRYVSYVGKTYALRYQKEWINALKMAWFILTAAMRAPGALFYYFGNRWVRYCREHGREHWVRNFAKRINLPRAEKHISRILGTRFKTVVTKLGGSALDIDNHKDFQTLTTRFKEWSARLDEEAGSV